MTATSPSWMAFAGRWGETGYIKLPNKDPLSSGSGPPGPAFQDHWQQPVKEVLSWPKG